MHQIIVSLVGMRALEKLRHNSFSMKKKRTMTKALYLQLCDTFVTHIIVIYYSSCISRLFFGISRAQDLDTTETSWKMFWLCNKNFIVREMIGHNLFIIFSCEFFSDFFLSDLFHNFIEKTAQWKKERKKEWKILCPNITYTLTNIKLSNQSTN